jgi:pimeloyl-ACP methyl ester carboxylesterase
MANLKGSQMSAATTAGDASGTAVQAGSADASSRPWWVELGSVLPRSVSFAARATHPPAYGGIPSLSVNPLSWATIAIDELAVSTAYLLSRRHAGEINLDRLDAANRAVDLLGASGAVADPRQLYPAPSLPAPVRLTRRGRGGIDFEQLSFDSQHPLPAGLAELADWQVAANASVHAYLLRHHDHPRPWVVVIHGHRMGEPRDLRMLGSRRLFNDLGVDVAHLVLPMHGPRGRVDGQAFPGIDPVANLLGVTQSVWDARSLLAWIRSQSDQPIGIFGVSLGGHVAAMLADLDPDLACVVAGVPLTDIAAMLSETVRSRWGDQAVADAHLLDPAPIELSRLSSPLTFEPVIPIERRFLYAAIGDRLVTAGQAEALWRHWDQPEILWLQGGHIINNVGASRRFVARALASSGIRVGTT